METTIIMFLFTHHENFDRLFIVFNAISIQMLSHCDLIPIIGFICSSVASVERGRV